MSHPTHTAYLKNRVAAHCKQPLRVEHVAHAVCRTRARDSSMACRERIGGSASATSASAPVRSAHDFHAAFLELGERGFANNSVGVVKIKTLSVIQAENRERLE